MNGAGATLQAAAMIALQTAPGIGGVYDGVPLQEAFPHAVVECGPESDWSHKNGTGREIRLAVTVRDKSEQPARLRGLVAEAEAALETIAADLDGWRLVTLQYLRSRVVREPQARSANGAAPAWAGVIEYRARMLAQ